MNVFGAWYGGSSYAAPGPGDLEPFGSIQEARRALENRYHNTSGSTPTVTLESEMLLYNALDALYVDWCRLSPFKRIYFGPRGGVRVEDL